MSSLKNRWTLTSATHGQEPPAGFVLRQTLCGHECRITRLAWSPNGRFIASTAFDGALRVWDPETGDLIRLMRPTGARSRYGLDSWTIGEQSGIAWRPAWSPDGRVLASGYGDELIRVWDVETGQLLWSLRGHAYKVNNVAWSPNGEVLASSADDATIKLWSYADGALIATLAGHRSGVNTIEWSRDGSLLASASLDGTVRIWDASTHETLFTLNGHSGFVTTVAWSPTGSEIASCSLDRTVRIWNSETGRQECTLEGHTDSVSCVAYSHDGSLLASKGIGWDGTVQLWRTDTWEPVGLLHEPSGRMWFAGIAFHPSRPVLATLCETDRDIRIWDLDSSLFRHRDELRRPQYYCSAKVVLVGESGTGKTCLARALTGNAFEPQESTHGMKIWEYESVVAEREDGKQVTRETALWDLAGQVDYQVVHQLFLDETAVGVVVFDPTHPENPFGGVVHWDRALAKVIGEGCPRLLVAGRVDRGHPTASAEDIEVIRQRFGYECFIATSAKTGDGLEALRKAIRQAVPWDRLPVTRSPQLWSLIRDYLHERRRTGEVLTRYPDLWEAFRQRHDEQQFREAEFDTVIRHAQAQGLVWQLSFGDFILLKPEILNDYAAAIVRAARNQQEGLGCVSEQEVLHAQIDFGDLDRLAHKESEGSLLYAVVQLLLRHELAVRESGQLVFPSKFNRGHPNMPASQQRDVAYRFGGPIEGIYATLVVRLYYCGAFRAKELWKNGAEFCDSLDNVCGFSLDSMAEGEGVISVFFSDSTPDNSRILFLQFIQDHLEQRALQDSVHRERIYRCPRCGEEVVNRRAIEARLSRGLTKIFCQFCDEPITLIDVLETKFAAPKLLNQLRQLEERVTERRCSAVGVTVAEAKKTVDEYDVFLAHNRLERSQVEGISRELRRRGLSPWLDKEQIPPGCWFQDVIQQAISNVKSAAIIVGPGGLGRWQAVELRAFISQCVEREIPVIPVLLPGAAHIPDELAILRELNLVEFKKGIDDRDAMDDLEWGITGEHPKSKM